MRSTTCQARMYGYPHEGCAEFGPPDSWECGRPGVVVIRTTFTDAEFARWALRESEDDVVDHVYDKLSDIMTLCEECLASTEDYTPLFGLMPYGEELVTLEAVL